VNYFTANGEKNYLKFFLLYIVCKSNIFFALWKLKIHHDD
jgi:hypothetical protein